MPSGFFGHLEHGTTFDLRGGDNQDIGMATHRRYSVDQDNPRSGYNLQPNARDPRRPTEPRARGRPAVGANVKLGHQGRTS